MTQHKQVVLVTGAGSAARSGLFKQVAPNRRTNLQLRFWALEGESTCRILSKHPGEIY